MSNSRYSAIAIIPAAGSGKRLKSKTPKPFVLLNKKPLLVWTIANLKKTYPFKQVIVVVDKKQVSNVQRMLKKYRITKAKVVEGGATRAESVKKGINSISTKVDLVCIHDAARPFIRSIPINELFKEASLKGASLLAEKATATVKLKSKKTSCVQETLDRNYIYLAQTPQVFKFASIAKVYRVLGKQYIKYTDEASMVEEVGAKVAIVPGPSINFKITTPTDLDIAKSIMR